MAARESSCELAGPCRAGPPVNRAFPFPLLAAVPACEAACSRRRLQVTGEANPHHVQFWLDFKKQYAKDPDFACHTPLHSDD